MKFLINILLLCFSSFLFAGITDPPTSSRTIESKKISFTPVIDGEKDAHYYQSNNQAKGFTTFEPIPGNPSEFETEVYVLFSEKGVFVFAEMKDKEPSKILTELSSRDEFSNSDYFGLTFDPYQAGLTGYSFYVTAAGVQVDIKQLTNDNQDWNWNEVWESETKITETGWTAEMFIPYYALRFPSGDLKSWNFQCERSVRRLREISFWNPVDPNVNGFLTQMGSIEKISSIQSPLRLSILPYLSVGLNTNLKKPNKSTTSFNYAGGADLKYGISDAFTLDMTLIPDFSQVISDVQVLNLSAFEVAFDENRPFFTEGTELFNASGLFYSRRIGDRPFISNGNLSANYLKPGETIISSPDKASLINAVKVSGRTNNNTGIGVFNAVEASTYAQVQSLDGNVREIKTNPLTNYSVLVVDQGLKNNSSISLTNTNVMRRGSFKDANVTGINWNLRNNKETYATSGSYALSQEFFQDSTQTGFNYELAFAKISGKWTYELEYGVESKKYNPNDLGLLFSPNEKAFDGRLTYNEYKPNLKNIITYRITAGASHNKIYDPNKFASMDIYNYGFVKWKNFFAAGYDIFVTPFGSHNYFEPRTIDFSQFLQINSNMYVGAFISSDYRKKFALDLRVARWGTFDGIQSRYDISINPRIRINNKWSLYPNIETRFWKDDMGYVGINPEESGLSLGQIPIGFRDISQITTGMRLQYIASNKVSCYLRLNHYFSDVQYNKFTYIGPDGVPIPIAYSGINDAGEKIHDITFNSFNADANMTWRFAPGSDLVISYQSSVVNFGNNSNYFDNILLGNNLLEESQINVKAIYFLDVNKLRKKSKI